MNRLEGRAKEVLDVCEKYVFMHGNFPTYRWIMSMTDITSTSMVHYYLEKLEKLRYIERIPERNGVFKILRT